MDIASVLQLLEHDEEAAMTQLRNYIRPLVTRKRSKFRIPPHLIEIDDMVHLVLIELLALARKQSLSSHPALPNLLQLIIKRKLGKVAVSVVAQNKRDDTYMSETSFTTNDTPEKMLILKERLRLIDLGLKTLKPKYARIIRLELSGKTPMDIQKTLSLEAKQYYNLRYMARIALVNQCKEMIGLR